MTILQALQAELDQMISQLDSVRDLAVEIIAHSARYSKMVEPLLTSLNLRWQEINDRIKVWIVWHGFSLWAQQNNTTNSSDP